MLNVAGLSGDGSLADWEEDWVVGLSQSHRCLRSAAGVGSAEVGTEEVGIEAEEIEAEDSAEETEVGFVAVAEAASEEASVAAVALEGGEAEGMISEVEEVVDLAVEDTGTFIKTTVVFSTHGRLEDEAAALAFKAVLDSTTTLRTDLAAVDHHQMDQALVGMEDHLVVGMEAAPADLDHLVEDMVAVGVGISSERAPVGLTTAKRNDRATSLIFFTLLTDAVGTKGDRISLDPPPGLRKWWTSYSFPATFFSASHRTCVSIAFVSVILQCTQASINT